MNKYGTELLMGVMTGHSFNVSISQQPLWRDYHEEKEIPIHISDLGQQLERLGKQVCQSMMMTKILMSLPSS